MPDEPAVTIDNRARAVLRALIREYVCCGQPVGSRRLAKVYPEKLSPATLRNVMADLEEAGVLEQPHVSAGRVPTPAGYRFYVNSLMRRRQLSQEELGTIRQALEQERDPEALMDRTSRLLASQTNSIGIVLVSGMIISTFFTLVFVPSIYMLIAGRRTARHHEPTPQPSVHQERSPTPVPVGA